MEMKKINFAFWSAFEETERLKANNVRVQFFLHIK